MIVGYHLSSVRSTHLRFILFRVLVETIIWPDVIKYIKTSHRLIKIIRIEYLIVWHWF